MRNSNNLKRYINDTKVLSLISIFLIGIIFLGGTYSWWTWTSGTNTLVTFTANSDFSCSADGGGDITSGDVSLIPASCTNSDHVIKRTITTTVTNSGKDSVSLDLWLNVDTLGSYLTGNSDFKYTLSTSDSCTSNLVTSGDFGSVSEGGTIQLLSSVENVTSSTDTYYLYIWLDKTETEIPPVDESARQFNLTIGGQCENKPISYTTVTLNANGGYIFESVNDWIIAYDSSSATKSITSGSTYGNLPTAELSGDTFLGWYTEPGGGGTLVTSDMQLVSDLDHTLYAHYGTPEIVVTLDKTDGYGWNETYDWIMNDDYAYATKSFSSGSLYGSLPIPDMDGEQEFLGWYTEPDGGGTLVTSDMQLVSDQNHTLYAYWGTPEVVVTLDKTNGYWDGIGNWTISDDMEYVSKSFSVGALYDNIPEPYSYDTGVVFLGWYTEPDGGGTLVTSDMQLVSDLDHTLYARWGAAGDN